MPARVPRSRPVRCGAGPTSAHSIDRMLASACSVPSTHEQSCRGRRQCMTMTRSILRSTRVVPDVRVPRRLASQQPPSAARPGHADAGRIRMGRNPASHWSARGGGAHSKWPGAGHMLPRPRESLQHHYLPGLGSLLPPRASPASSVHPHCCPALSALRGRNVDNCNSCLHAWTGSVAWHRQPAWHYSAGLVDCTVCTARWRSIHRSITVVGLTGPGIDRRRPARSTQTHTVGTRLRWELAVRPEP